MGLARTLLALGPLYLADIFSWESGDEGTSKGPQSSLVEGFFVLSVPDAEQFQELVLHLLIGSGIDCKRRCLIELASILPVAVLFLGFSWCACLALWLTPMSTRR